MAIKNNFKNTFNNETVNNPYAPANPQNSEVKNNVTTLDDKEFSPKSINGFLSNSDLQNNKNEKLLYQKEINGTMYYSENPFSKEK